MQAFNLIVTIVMVLLLSFAAITHALRIVYLYFAPKFLQRITFISSPDLGRQKLTLYYLLTLLVCLYGIQQKLLPFIS